MNDRYLFTAKAAKFACILLGVFLSVLLMRLPLLEVANGEEIEPDSESIEEHGFGEASSDNQNIDPDASEVGETDFAIDDEENDDREESDPEETEFSGPEIALATPGATSGNHLEESLEESSEDISEAFPEHFIEKSFWEEPTASNDYILAPNERIVTSFEELKDALGENNGVTTVYFGADITMKAGGIHIDDSKSDIIVDGYNPRNPNQEKPYTLTDYSVLQIIEETVYADTIGVKSLLIRDLDIIGKNFFGPFSARDVSGTQNLVITYLRVNYNGPQIGYHRRGLVRFIDCDIKIHAGNGGSLNQEFSEVKHLKFEGRNTIDTASGATSIFWHPSGGSFEVMDNSTLTVTANNMGTFYGLFYAGASIYKVDILIGQSAVFDVTISGMFQTPAYVTLSSFRVSGDGVFRMNTTKAPTAAVMVVGGEIEVEENASFLINGYGGASYALLEQSAGDITVGRDATFQLVASRRYSTLLNLYGSSMKCNDPASVLFYNPDGRTVQATTSAGKLSVTAEQLNYWQAAGDGGFDDSPKSEWRSSSTGADIAFEWSVAVGASGNLTLVNSNYTSSDLGLPPNAANYSLTTGRVLSFGRLALEISAPMENSDHVTGFTTPGTAVRVIVKKGEASDVLPDTFADENGVFHAYADGTLAGYTNVDAIGKFQYLTAYASTAVSPIGKVEFIVPQELAFFTTELAPKTRIVHRLNSHWHIAVSDTRGAGNGWQVYVRELQPLTAQTGAVLRNALIFVDGAGDSAILNNVDLQPVYQHTSGSGEDLTLIQWAAEQGVLARIEPGAALAEPYSADLEWILVDAP